MKFTFSKSKEFADAGFNTNVNQQSTRFINKDGTFNTKKVGLSQSQSFSLFHWLISLPWIQFIGLVLLGFLGINLLFAIAYMVLGLDGLNGIKGITIGERFTEAFFFSAQTLTTVGYGHINPVSVMHSSIAALEACIGLLLFAVATGLMYGRFASPDRKILFSENLLIAPYKNDECALMFRCANATRTNIIEAEIQFMVSAIITENGQKVRRFYTLDLERNKVVFFSMSWTVVHPLDENSPLAMLSRQEMDESEAEFMVLFKGFDTTFNQTIYLPTSYKAEDIIWGAKFVNILNADEDKKNTIVNLDKLSAYSLVDLPNKDSITTDSIT
jgi:inward rectifier potassium channel